MRYLIFTLSTDDESDEALTSIYAVPAEHEVWWRWLDALGALGALADDDEPTAGLSSPQMHASLRRVLFTRSAECAVCLSQHEHFAAELACGHSFHRPCIERWLRIAASCPICRATVGTARGRA